MKILSSCDLNQSQQEIIRAASPDADLVIRPSRSPEQLSAALAGGCEVLLTFTVSDDISERARELKWVQLLSAGADHLLAGTLGRCPSPIITTSSGIHSVVIAQYIIASMLAYTHRMHMSIRAQEERQWLRTGSFMKNVRELRGQTLGVIGYGSIGRETARLANAFGMAVLALKRGPAAKADTGWCRAGIGDPDGTIPKRYFGPGERLDLLARSDYVAVTLPLTGETRRFIGAPELAVMKPTAYLVNIGRGEVIDEAAMIEALGSGKIGGAGLDVFEHEPLPPESPLWRMENAILTPHMAGAHDRYIDLACEIFAENLLRYRRGERLLNLVDRSRGY